jgi:hypothetical protein
MEIPVFEGLIFDVISFMYSYLKKSAFAYQKRGI